MIAPGSEFTNLFKQTRGWDRDISCKRADPRCHTNYWLFFARIWLKKQPYLSCASSSFYFLHLRSFLLLDRVQIFAKHTCGA